VVRLFKRANVLLYFVLITASPIFNPLAVAFNFIVAERKDRTALLENGFKKWRRANMARVFKRRRIQCGQQRVYRGIDGLKPGAFYFILLTALTVGI
jgi:hypothetical protein